MDEYNKFTMSPPDIDEGKWLPKDYADLHLWWIKEERRKRAQNDMERKRYQDYYDGFTPKDDRASEQEYLRDIQINQIAPHVNWIVAELAKRRNYPVVFPMSGTGKGDFYAAVKRRDFQSRALFTASGFHEHRAAALLDAMTSGDGWIHYGLRPAPGGRMQIFAKHRRWDTIMFDSYAAEANGSVQDGRFMAHFSLVEVDHFATMFPKFRNLASQLCRGSPQDDQSPLDSESGGSWTDYFPAADSPALFGDGDIRRYVVYGVFFFRHPVTRELYKYPFLTDRGLTEIHALTPLSQPYSHHRYPFLRFVAAAFMRNGLPYSPMRHKIGLERRMQYMLRGAAEKTGGTAIFFEEGAIPRGSRGERRQTTWEFAAYLQRQAREANPTIGVADGALSRGLIQWKDNNTEAAELIKLIMEMSHLQGVSGGAPHKALTGGAGKSPHSAVSMREHMDNALAGNRFLFDTDKRAIADAGRMNLYFIEDYENELPLLAFLDDGGEQRMVSEEMGEEGGEEAALMRLAVTDIGVAVNARERKADVIQDILPVLTESLKSFAGNANLTAIVTTVFAKELNWDSSLVDAMIEGFLKSGVDMPDFLLSPRLRQINAQTRQVQQQKQDEAEGFEKAAASAEIDKTEAEADKARGQGVQARTAGAKNLADAEAAEGSNKSMDSLLAYVAELERAVTQAGGQLPKMEAPPQ